MMDPRVEIERAAKVLMDGGLIAYPTESCYGLGCLPDSVAAIERLLKLKRRHRAKGLILVSDQFKRFTRYLNLSDEIDITPAMQSWPGPVTWLIPADEDCPALLKGEFDSLAVRVSAHEGVRQLCVATQSALVSSSANRTGQPSLRRYNEVLDEFAEELDYVLEGQIGGDSKPSEIRDLLSQEIIRAA